MSSITVVCEEDAWVDADVDVDTAFRVLSSVLDADVDADADDAAFLERRFLADILKTSRLWLLDKGIHQVYVLKLEEE
jgi:hypothetical protein